MKRKKILIIFIIILIIFIILGIFYIKEIKILKQNNEEEYIPEKEFSEEKRKTLISLYFIDKETEKIVPEPRLINIEEMLKEPEKKLIELLIGGPKNERYISEIPKDTKIINIEKNKGEIIVKLSKEKIEEKNANKEKISECIKMTVAQLNEIDEVKVKIED